MELAQLIVGADRQGTVNTRGRGCPTDGYEQIVPWEERETEAGQEGLGLQSGTLHCSVGWQKQDSLGGQCMR